MAFEIHSQRMLISKIELSAYGYQKRNLKIKRLEEGKWEGGEAGLRTHCAIPDFNMWYSNECSHALHQINQTKIFSYVVQNFFLHKTP